MTGASSQSNRSVCVGRGHNVKVNILIFKDDKSQDAITNCSWQWDIAIFCQSGWDNQYLLPYIFCSQGFPGYLARSFGADVTLNDVLHMLEKQCGVVMTFDTLNKELYSL